MYYDSVTVHFFVFKPSRTAMNFKTYYATLLIVGSLQITCSSQFRFSITKSGGEFLSHNSYLTITCNVTSSFLQWISFSELVYATIHIIASLPFAFTFHTDLVGQFVPLCVLWNDLIISLDLTLLRRKELKEMFSFKLLMGKQFNAVGQNTRSQMWK